MKDKDLSEKNLLIRLYFLQDEGLINFNKSGSKLMAFDGTFKEAQERLRQSLNSLNRRDTIAQFLYAPRIIRGVIDYGLKYRSRVLGLKVALEQVCLSIFGGNLNVAQDLLDRCVFPKSLLSFRFQEEVDNISWYSFNPTDNEELIIKLDENTLKRPDFVVMDGHDSYRSGFAIANALESNVLCLRNSLDSGRDIKPRPLREETQYMNHTLTGKRVLIYGEDASTGTAIKALRDLVLSASVPTKVETAATILISTDEQRKIPINYFGAEKKTFS